MSKVCQVTGKRPITGNNVSHSHRKTRRRFLPNLHYHRFWVESEQRFVRLRVSTAGMRIIDKKGIDRVLNELRARFQDLGRRLDTENLELATIQGETKSHQDEAGYLIPVSETGFVNIALGRTDGQFAGRFRHHLEGDLVVVAEEGEVRDRLLAGHHLDE